MTPPNPSPTQSLFPHNVPVQCTCDTLPGSAYSKQQTMFLIKSIKQSQLFPSKVFIQANPQYQVLTRYFKNQAWGPWRQGTTYSLHAYPDNVQTISKTEYNMHALIS